MNIPDRQQHSSVTAAPAILNTLVICRAKDILYFYLFITNPNTKTLVDINIVIS